MSKGPHSSCYQSCDFECIQSEPSAKVGSRARACRESDGTWRVTLAVGIGERDWADQLAFVNGVDSPTAGEAVLSGNPPGTVRRASDNRWRKVIVIGDGYMTPGVRTPEGSTEMTRLPYSGFDMLIHAAPFNISRQMRCMHVLLAVLFVGLLCKGSWAFPRCCWSRKCNCPYFRRLFGPRNHGHGILTVGKRQRGEAEYKSPSPGGNTTPPMEDSPPLWWTSTRPR
ncbi:hypothetical protein Bbelb_256570 [Branchiostoma belcheri]|nr:hypothetical protein Bbelb_256570 [Branchiostoma belcheri]